MKKREVLDAIANALIEKESLEQKKEYNEIIRKFGIEPKTLPENKKQVIKARIDRCFAKTITLENRFQNGIIVPLTTLAQLV